MSSDRVTQRPSFPRSEDRLGRSRALAGREPDTVAERFSRAYEAQVAAVWDALETHDLKVWLTGAGTEDGETICAGRAYDDVALVVHLEDPNEARAVAEARNENRLDEYIASGLG